MDTMIPDRRTLSRILASHLISISMVKLFITATPTPFPAGVPGARSLADDLPLLSFYAKKLGSKARNAGQGNWRMERNHLTAF